MPSKDNNEILCEQVKDLFGLVWLGLVELLLAIFIGIHFYYSEKFVLLLSLL